MDYSETARFAADKISAITTIKGLSVNKMLKMAGLDKSVVSRMKKGIMPSGDKIAAIASVLDVPMNFLVGSGIFEKWDLILEHRTAILSKIADMMKDLSANLENGVDDLTLAKLVWAFGIDIGMGEEPAGTEILVVSPIATSDVVASSQNVSNMRIGDIKKEPASEISDSGRKMLEYFCELPHEQQQELLIEARTYHKIFAKEKTDQAGGMVG